MFLCKVIHRLTIQLKLDGVMNYVLMLHELKLDGGNELCSYVR